MPTEQLGTNGTNGACHPETEDPDFELRALPDHRNPESRTFQPAGRGDNGPTDANRDPTPLRILEEGGRAGDDVGSG
ncbi:hypothetical protein VTI28DRAFT_528 [Corynascus sepedonium]